MTESTPKPTAPRTIAEAPKEQVRVPVALLQRIWDNQAILFLGAGASLAAKAPSSGELEKRLADMVGLEPTGRLDQTFDAVVAMEERSKVERLVRQALEGIGPAAANVALARYPWRAVFTTNVDLIFEKAHAQAKTPATTINVVIESDDFYDLHDPRQTTYIKLHGCVSKAPSPKTPLVFGQSDLVNVRERNAKLFREIGTLGHQFSLVFVGYSFQDGVLSELLAELKKSLGEGWMSRSYAILPSVSPAQKAILDRYGISHVPATLESFVAELEAKSKANGLQYVARTRVEPILQIGKSKVELDPETFAAIDPEMELLVADRMVVEPSNEFYRGAQPQWADVHHGLDVPRSVHDSLLEAVVGVPEGSPASLTVLTGSGATGKSTAAMRACYEAYTRHSIPVVRLKPDRHWRPQTLDLLSTRLEGRRFIVLADGMPDAYPRVRELVHHAMSLALPCSFLLTLRTNEWGGLKVDYPAPHHTQIEIPEQLSHAEARGLAEKLVDRGVVKTSASKTIDDLVVKIVRGCDNYLLVVLIDVVEAQKLEVLVRREYESLPNPQSKRAYLAAALFHQFGREIGRNHMLRHLDVFPDKWYDGIFKPHLLKLLVDRWDDVRQNEYYRTRHNIVSQILVRQLRRTTPGDGQVDVRQEFLDLVAKCSGYSEYESQQLHQLARLEPVKDFLGPDDRIHAFYRTAVQAMPTHAWLYVFYAQWLESKKDLDKAEEVLVNGLDTVHAVRAKAALTRHLAYVDLLRMRAATDAPEATFYYERGLERATQAKHLDPNHDYAYATTIELLSERARSANSPAQALEILYDAQAVAKAGRSSVPDEHLRQLPGLEARLTQEIGRIEIQLELGKPGKGVQPPAWYLRAANQLEATGKTPDALAVTTKGLDLHPKNMGLCRKALELAGKTAPEPATMKKLIDLALAADDTDRHFLACAGAWECQFGKPERAAQLFSKAAKDLEIDFRLVRPLDLGWLGRPTEHLPGTIAATQGPVGHVRLAPWSHQAVFLRYDGDNRKFKKDDRVLCAVRFAYQGPMVTSMRFD